MFNPDDTHKGNIKKKFMLKYFNFYRKIVKKQVFKFFHDKFSHGPKILVKTVCNNNLFNVIVLNHSRPF